MGPPTHPWAMVPMHQVLHFSACAYASQIGDSGVLYIIEVATSGDSFA